MFEDLLRSQREQRSKNSRARQIIVSQIETQNPPESRSTVELNVIVDEPYTKTEAGDNYILQSVGPTLLPSISASNYLKPPGSDRKLFQDKRILQLKTHLNGQGPQ